MIMPTPPIIRSSVKMRIPNSTVERRGLYAQIAHHPQCHNPYMFPLENRFRHLISKTVALVALRRPRHSGCVRATLREWVQNTTLRMGFPAFTLPLITAARIENAFSAEAENK